MKRDACSYMVRTLMQKVLGLVCFLLGCVALALVFSSTLVWVACGVIAALLVLRTHLEDKMLLEELPGYRQYALKTRCRLLPFVW